jgi:hypothetical protein
MCKSDRGLCDCGLGGSSTRTHTASSIAPTPAAQSLQLLQLVGGDLAIALERGERGGARLREQIRPMHAVPAQLPLQQLANLLVVRDRHRRANRTVYRVARHREAGNEQIEVLRLRLGDQNDRARPNGQRRDHHQRADSQLAELAAGEPRPHTMARVAHEEARRVGLDLENLDHLTLDGRLTLRARQHRLHEPGLLVLEQERHPDEEQGRSRLHNSKSAALKRKQDGCLIG